MLNLAGRTAVLTGAAGGIGPFIARELARERMNLVLAAPSLGEIECVASEIREHNVRVISVETDVASPTALNAMVARANHEFGAVDVLVNNAGINNVLPYHKLRVEDIEHITRVNLTGPMLLAWLLLPGMLERGHGHIVNMASLAGKLGVPFCGPYSATKAGLIGFTESVRSEYRDRGVSASVVCPGFVTAGIYEQLVNETGLHVPRIVGTSPPELVAHAVVRAIKEDMPEITVAPIRTSLFVKFAMISPTIIRPLERLLGVSVWRRKVADARLDGSARPGEDTSDH
jgi:short-subunit dehydrogenase